MGYYTLHKISIINKKHNNLRNLERLLKVIEEVTEYTFRIESESYIIDDTWNCGYGSKWYSFDKDIYVISEKLPKLKILVEAEEENGHTWDVIVKKGYDSYNSPSDNEEGEESEEDEENEDNEEDENEEEEIENDNDNIIYNNNDIGIEEIYQDMKINDTQIFKR